MSLDDRGRSAAWELHRVLDRSSDLDGGVDLVERFHRERSRRERRDRRRGAIVGGAFAIVVMVLLAIGVSVRGVAPAGTSPTGTILYGRWRADVQRSWWFTAGVDGRDVRDLGISATCARWWPDGSKILVTDDDAVGPGRPLRPATIRPDGSGMDPLDATMDPSLNLGCGDVAPDGRLLVLEGFNDRESGRNGIYLVRASDGGGLRRVVASPRGASDGNPVFSPDGTRIAFFRIRPGVSPPGAGALFTVNLDGSSLRRITSWGGAFLGQEWAPDGSWIVYQRPYGVLSLVHPDGTGRRDVPVSLASGSGAANPAWSPDGAWIVFSLRTGEGANIFRVRPDGSSLTRITSEPGVDEQSPSWTGRADPSSTSARSG